MVDTHYSEDVYCISLLCHANHCEYGKSWNSYGDLCHKMGFGKGQRSEVMRLIGNLAEQGLIKKTVRKVKGVYVDNIYRICGFDCISATSGVGCDFTDNILLQKGMRENGKTERKNNGLRGRRMTVITANCGIFEGVRLLS